METIISLALHSGGDALRAYEELVLLDRQGLLTLADAIILRKDPRGQVSVEAAENSTISHPVGGALIGGLIGLLGGVPDYILDTVAGALAGATLDPARAGFPDTYAAAIAQGIKNDSAALVAYLWEDAPALTNGRLAQLEGKLRRTFLNDHFDRELSRQMYALVDQAQDLNASLPQKAPVKQEQIREQLRHLEAQREALTKKLQLHVQVRKHLYQQWLRHIKDKRTKAKENALTVRKKLRLQTLEFELNEQLDGLERTTRQYRTLLGEMDAALNLG